MLEHPGRVMDLIKRKKIIPKNFDTAVLDEADEMLNMGFRDDIEKILVNYLIIDKHYSSLQLCLKRF